MTKIIELRQERARLIKESREKLDSSEKLTPEIRAAVEERDKRIDELDERILLLEKQEAREQTLGDVLGSVDDAQRKNRDGEGDAESRHIDTFMKHLRGEIRVSEVPAELRVLGTGTGADGGMLVPTTWENRIYELLKEMSPMRSLATVLPMTAAEHNIPMEGDTTAAAYIDESGAYPTDTDTITNKAFKANKIGKIVKVSEELLADAGVSIEQYINRLIAWAFEQLEGSEFTLGSTSGKIGGVLEEGTIVGSSLAAVDYDDILDLIYSVASTYAMRGTIMMNRSYAKTVRQLKDGSGNYILKPATGSFPDTIEGKPIAFNPYMGTGSSGDKIIAFGDFSQYHILDRQGIAVQRLNELYAANGQIGFKTSKRTDGHLMVAAAVKYLELT